MHEASLVRSLLRQIGELLAEHQGESVTSVRVELGPLSGVEPELVKIAFAELVEESPCRGAELTIEEVPLTACCRACGAETKIEAYRFLCPTCGSSQLRMTGGDEFRLLDVVLLCNG